MNLSVNIQQDHSEAVIDLEHAQVQRIKAEQRAALETVRKCIMQLEAHGCSGTSQYSIAECIMAVDDLDGMTAKGALHFDNGDLKGLTV